MKRIVLGALAVALSLYAVPAHGDAPPPTVAAPTTIDLASVPNGPDTTLPVITRLDDTTFLFTAGGSAAIRFRPHFTNRVHDLSYGEWFTPENFFKNVFPVGGGPKAWLVEVPDPVTVSRDADYTFDDRVYRLAPNGAMTLAFDPPGHALGHTFTASATLYATLVGRRVSVYRAATGSRVSSRRIPGSAKVGLVELDGPRLALNVGSRSLVWNVRSRAATWIPSPLLGLANGTVVLDLTPTRSPAHNRHGCFGVSRVGAPTTLLWQRCARFDGLSPDGRLVLAMDPAAEGQGDSDSLLDLAGRTLTSYEITDANGHLEDTDEFAGWAGPETPTFTTENPLRFITCSPTACTRGPSHPASATF